MPARRDGSSFMPGIVTNDCHAEWAVLKFPLVQHDDWVRERETCGTRGRNLNGALSDIALKPWLTWKVFESNSSTADCAIAFSKCTSCKTLDRPCKRLTSCFCKRFGLSSIDEGQDPWREERTKCPTLHQTMNKLTYGGLSPIPVRSKQIGMVADHDHTKEGVQSDASFRVTRADLFNCEVKIAIRRCDDITLPWIT
jgi:hypothetical protein